MEPFLAEIRLFSFGFTPKGWLPCEGQVLSVNQNFALFSLLGAQYGGDGKTTFALPDLRGKVALGFTGDYQQGKPGGEAQHALTVNELPTHNHVVSASSAAVASDTPVGATWGSFTNGYSTTSNTQLGAPAIAIAGAGAPHQNMQPSMALNFCIATQGLYPPRP